MPLNRERAYKLMRDRGVDAVVASSPENVYYISDYLSLGQRLRCGTQAYTILPLEGDPAIVAPINEVDLIVESSSWITDVSFYGLFNTEIHQSNEFSEQTKRLIDIYSSAELEDDAISALARVLKEKSLTSGVLALDTSRISATLFKLLNRELPDVKIVEGTDLLHEIRLIKTEEEVARIRKATEITEKSMEDALEIARPEIMEVDLAGMFEYSIAYDRGQVTLNLIGFGERSSYLHPIPSPLEAGRGDTIRLTLGCKWHQYHSNISRTAVIGRPRSKLKKLWEAVITAQDAALDTVKPGIKVSDVYALAEKELRTADLKQINATFGHGLGVECMEKPIISKDEDMALMEGMVLNIDIPYLELGWGGVQLEDTILVTDDGFELITNTERTLYLL